MVSLGFGGLGGCEQEEQVQAAVAALASELSHHFPAGCGVRVLAEAGRHFAEPASTLATLVYGKRPSAESGWDYWVAEDGPACGGAAAGAAAAAARALLLRGERPAAGAPAAPCTVLGAGGADGMRCALPECAEGDWVALPGLGAQPLGCESDAPTFYVVSRDA